MGVLVGCRPSVLFRARADGMLDAWDYYLNSQTAPALSVQVLHSPPVVRL